MITTMWTTDSAGACGPVGLAARPAACTAERPGALRLRDLPLTAAVTGVPAPRVVGAPPRGAGVFGTSVFALVPTARGDAPAVEVIGTTASQQQDSEHDDPTLGSPSSRRPLS
ncbi:hypothetical protein [Geodermatophilus sp. TF02-6]|uniref:hypothetical protein n=1 Tax=Geodermatophilus sp. TF02-6 TaxID=2250575 RepID=UPI0011BEA6F3|nr:hypothetical protein [Geodermatophilus sp. TF02-6]